MSMRMGVSRSGPNPLTGFQWQQAAAQWATDITPLVREVLRSEAPVGKGPDAGRLRDSIRAARRTGAGSVTIEFSADTPYAGFVLDGTPPHLIRARAARYLHWVDAGGRNHFAKQVNHPGTKPNPFPRRAITPLLPVIQRRYAAILADSTRR